MDDKAFCKAINCWAGILWLCTVVLQGFWLQSLEHFKSISQMLPSKNFLGMSEKKLFLRTANEYFNFCIQI